MALRKRKRFLKKVIIFCGLFAVSWSILALFCFATGQIIYYQDLFCLVLATLVSLLCYKPFDRLISNIFFDFIFKKKIGYSRQLNTFVKSLASCLDLKEFSNLVVNTLPHLLGVKFCVLVSYDGTKNEYTALSGHGMSLQALSKIRFTHESPIIKLLRERKKSVLRDAIITKLPWQEASPLNTDLELVGATLLVPLFFERDLIGFIGLSRKRETESYCQQDLNFFNAVKKDLALALRNAVLFSEKENLIEELKDVQSVLLQSAKLTAIEQLATGIAHEIHNPLTIISGKSQVLLLNKNKDSLTPKIAATLQSIVRQSNRASEIVRKLLIFSKPAERAWEKIDFHKLIGDVVSLVSFQSESNKVQIETRIEENLPDFHGNLSEIREVLLNLVINGVRAIENVGTVKISVRQRKNGEHIEIRVSDTGKGISEENLQKVFNPFFSTYHEGIGLGLFVAQQIVSRHKGAIRAESEVGKGTIFIVTLPSSKSKFLGVKIDEQVDDQDSGSKIRISLPG